MAVDCDSIPGFDALHTGEQKAKLIEQFPDDVAKIKTPSLSRYIRNWRVEREKDLVLKRIAERSRALMARMRI